VADNHIVFVRSINISDAPFFASEFPYGRGSLEAARGLMIASPAALVGKDPLLINSTGALAEPMARFKQRHPAVRLTLRSFLAVFAS